MGQVRMAPLKVGSRTFLGNGAMLSGDAHIGDDALIGVMSTPPPAKPSTAGLSKEQIAAMKNAPILWPETRTEVSDGQSYLGSPPMLLPNRAQAQGSFDIASTFKPTRWLYAQRLMWEFFRIVIPFMIMYVEQQRADTRCIGAMPPSRPPYAHMHILLVCHCATSLVVPRSALMIGYMGNFEDLFFAEEDSYASLALFWLVTWPACYVCAAALCCFVTLLLKWALVGTYTPGEAPLWSNFVWRTELCVGVMEALANPFVINHIRGTPFVCMWFRLLGCTIGERVWMDTTQITEPDLVIIGSDCILQQDCTLQVRTHTDTQKPTPPCR